MAPLEPLLQAVLVVLVVLVLWLRVEQDPQWG